MIEPAVTYVDEGWWHPNVKDGRVHDHPEDGQWSRTMHRECEPVYTRRPAASRCSHCHAETTSLSPCPFDPEMCRLCPTCTATAAADYGPLGYPLATGARTEPLASHARGTSDG
jgi:hypothetical protein